ncbi:MAG: glycosyltransferase family 9 protein [Chloroflexi bacterium]|nr:glycosyltransferase family 9 protein [Chloroflexota bacterium]
MGDVLTATPALRALRRGFPQAHISALLTPHCRELLEASPLVDQVLTFGKRAFDSPSGLLRPGSPGELAGLAARLRAGRYDALVLLHHLTTPWGAAKYAALATATGAPVRAGLDNGRGRFLTHRAMDLGFGVRHEVEYWNAVVEALGAAPDYGPLELSLRPEDAAFAREALPPTLPGPRIVIHAGSGSYSTARRWPLGRFVELGRLLVQRLGATLVLVGGKEEEALARHLARTLGPSVIDLAGRTTLRQLGAVLRACDLFVGNDSGVMHLATAVGTPVVALFGPSNHRAWGPWTPGRAGAPALVLRAPLPCSPCFYVGHGLGTPEGCPNRTCLQLISPEQVTDAIQRLLVSRPAHPVAAGRPDS